MLPTALILWAGLASLLWCAIYLRGARLAGRLLELERLPGGRIDRLYWPRLSVIIAARDEVATLREALGTLLAETYPLLEIVLVDDRSTDGTGALIDALAKEDPRIVPIHVTELPDGWLGKVHALDRGTEEATGEWLLYSDADVHFRPGVLLRAMGYVLGQDVEHLSVMPRFESATVLEEIVVATSFNVLLAGARAGRVGAPGSKAYLGIGAFNLVRRTAFERTPGFSWLALEVLDDMGLARMLSEAGARPAFAVSRGDLSMRWYPSLGAMARGLEKVLLAAGRYRVLRVMLQGLGLWALALGPLVALLPGAPLWVRIAAGLALVSLWGSAIVRSRKGGRRLIVYLLAPIGQLVLGAFVLRAAWVGLRTGSVRWRGTEYRFAALRAGRRV